MPVIQDFSLRGKKTRELKIGMQFSHTIDIQSVNKIPQNNREKNTIKVMKQYINDRWKQSKTLTFSN